MKIQDDIQVNQYLTAVTDQMTFGEAREGTRKELLSHVEENVEAALSYGVPESKVIGEALKRMGAAKELGLSLNKIHQPKFFILLPLLTVLLSALSIWNLSGTRWLGPQLLWEAVGLFLVSAIYFLPIRTFKNLVASFYVFAILGLVLSYFSGVVADGQPYLAIAGLQIKIVDLAGILFALGFPALDLRLQIPQKLSAIVRLGLFLLPMTYFSYNGFIWPGLLFLISGLSYLGMSGISTLGFVVAGLLGSGMLAIHFNESVLAIQDLNHAVVENSHTDFALRSMQDLISLQILAIALLVVLAMYSIKKAFAIKDHSLRAMALAGSCLLTVQIFTSVLVNMGLLPMISAGINIPFISYGGSGIVGNFLLIGILLGCLKRQALSVV